jgi:hypothetical protein
MVQVVEDLPSKCKALSSSPSTAKKNSNKQKQTMTYRLHLHIHDYNMHFFHLLSCSDCCGNEEFKISTGLPRLVSQVDCAQFQGCSLTLSVEGTPVIIWVLPEVNPEARI